jgi:hypothetical protein
VKASECGTVRPPADGTPARQAIDRFADFLREVGPPPKRGEHLHLSPAQRYRARFLAWRLTQPIGAGR